MSTSSCLASCRFQLVLMCCCVWEGSSDDGGDKQDTIRRTKLVLRTAWPRILADLQLRTTGLAVVIS